MLGVFLCLVWVHFVADFVLQSDSMALNKSKNNAWLFAHSFVYGFSFLWWGWEFAAMIGIAHFHVDWVTSRGTAWLWQAEKRHWFFALIGFDQALHITILALMLPIV